MTHHIATRSKSQSTPIQAPFIFDLNECFPAPATPGELALLGNTTKLSSADVSDFVLKAPSASPLLAFKDKIAYATTPAEQRIERYANLATARDILPGSRTAQCLHSVKQGANCVPVKYSKKSGRAHFKNLQICGSVWRCAVCAAKISEHRRASLTRATANFKSRTGGQVLLATRTFPHSSSDTVAHLMEGLKKAEKLFKSGRQWTAIVAQFGIAGTVRNVEITFGIHGAHPHIHELLFVTGSFDADALAALQEALYLKWAGACHSAGLGTPTRAHGVDVRDGNKAAAYLLKMGKDDQPENKREWTNADELTKSHMKKGKGQSLSPFDLLRIARQATGKVASLARRYFREYAEAFHGKRQLVISPKLKAYFEEEEKTDEEAAKDLDADASVLVSLTLAGWKEVLRHKVRGQLLEVAASNDADRVKAYLHKLSPSLAIADLFLDLTLYTQDPL